jgi:hypothetical protein
MIWTEQNIESAVHQGKFYDRAYMEYKGFLVTFLRNREENTIGYKVVDTLFRESTHGDFVKMSDQMDEDATVKMLRKQVIQIIDNELI